MKHLSIIRYVFSAISVVLTFLLMYNAENTIFTDILLYWMYFLLVIAVVVALIFPIMNIALNPKAALRSMTGLGILAVVLVVSYALSSAEPIVTQVRTFDNATELRLSDVGLYATYFTLVATILSVVYAEISKALK